ncbi:MAG: serine hydroxymethyltransferase [Sedimentisphaerales bacterium]|nr:serine hydroxymethyltransferase [Sedimentisphaerales bacterium]
MTFDALSSEAYHADLLGALKKYDPDIYKLIKREYHRLQNSIQLLAAENLCSRSVLAALGSILQNKTSEGFPAARLHGGSGIVDEVESTAIERAKEVFRAKYANVQPHSGTTANQIVITALLERGDKILSMATSHGGHFSHGSIDSLTAKFFEIESYRVDRETFLLDYDQIRKQARQFRPKLIICGASAYPRIIDFGKFRQIADEVGAILLADISHLSALVMGGAHPSPIDYAHVTTASTYKPGGPRGGLILAGRDYDMKIKVAGKEAVLWRQIEKTTFPGLQGTPYFNNIAAKAVFFKEAGSKEYKARQLKVAENAKWLAGALAKKGYNLLTGGTDNHMLIINVSGISEGLSSPAAQKCLEQCGIVVDKMPLPYDDKPAMTGIRLGTPIVTKNGMGAAEMDRLSDLIDGVLKNIKPAGQTERTIEQVIAENIRNKTKELAARFPIR